MKTVKISLNSIDKVKAFVNDITKFDYDFDLVSGRYVIDAKSIMGIFSLDLRMPICMTVNSDDCGNIFDAVKEYLIKIMGPRQFEQLFKAYAKESTSQSDRDLMSKVRTILKQRGYTRDNFLGRYRK